MVKRLIISGIAIFVVWTLLDFLVHGVLLENLYISSSELWRPMEEAKMGLNSFVVLLSSFLFVAIYIVLVDRKHIKNALLYGLLFGLAQGVPMGYGTFAFQPIPYMLAFSWCALRIVECLIGGAILNLVTRNDR